MATKANTKTRVAVMKTATGTVLSLHNGQTLKAVRGFVAEHNRRFLANEPGGPDGNPALQIVAAYWFDEPAANDKYDWDAGTPIDIKAALKSPDATR